MKKPSAQPDGESARIFMAILLSLLCLTAGSCKQIEKSLSVSRRAVDEYHQGKARSLCSRFSEEMVEAMPCDSLELILRQVSDLEGAPQGRCKWYYGYNIVSFDPFRTVTTYQCPYQEEAVKVTVVVDVIESGTFVSGLWTDSKRLRRQRLLTRVELCDEVDQNSNWCRNYIDRAAWSQTRIYVWTSWQGIRPGDQLVMEWFDPEGEPRADFSHSVGEYSGKIYNFWSWIEPETIEVPNPQGVWTVKIGVNGKPVHEHPVEVLAGQRP